MVVTGGLTVIVAPLKLLPPPDQLYTAPAPATTPPPKQKKIQEASGYIPKNKQEANDPRWQMAMTQDIKPGEDKRQAERMGWHLDSNGKPPKLSTSGKTNEAVVDVAVQAREPLSPGSFGLMRSRADYGAVIHHPKRIYKAAVEALTARLEQKVKVEQEISNIAHQFKTKEGNLVRAFEMIKRSDPHDYHKKAIDKIKKSPLKI